MAKQEFILVAISHTRSSTRYHNVFPILFLYLIKFVNTMALAMAYLSSSLNFTKRSLKNPIKNQQMPELMLS